MRILYVCRAHGAVDIQACLQVAFGAYRRPVSVLRLLNRDEYDVALRNLCVHTWISEASGCLLAGPRSAVWYRRWRAYAMIQAPEARQTPIWNRTDWGAYV